ncbi:MAG: hypothetical protein E6Q97_31735 [Desulfurellales bacterium]|nr:MAG: hypothetical protein E6Q97_31735 [Desulfurellales bacterium]
MLYVSEFARRAYLEVATSPRPSLHAKRRRALVDSTATILATGFHSKFEFEASCRHGLRRGFILDGWGWSQADDTAANIVAAALRSIGAQRPTWLQAQTAEFQDGAQVPRERCLGCGRQLLGEVAERFCSRGCKGAWRRKINAKWMAKEAETAAKAEKLT